MAKKQPNPNPVLPGPGYRVHYGVDPVAKSYNYLEGDNPTGGSIRSTGLSIDWQNGPRASVDSSESPGLLEDRNGAFVEDAIYAALQRLEFFQSSKYADRANALAITHLEAALQALTDRSLERAWRGVQGKHEV